MEWQPLFLIMLGIMFFLLFLGEWIAFTLLLTGCIGLVIIGKANTMTSIGIFAWNTVRSFELTAIPMFILMGEIMVHGGLSKGFYNSALKWLNRLPGGLLQSNIVSCTIFAAISGSSPATAAAIGAVSYPEMSKKGYDRKMLAGSLAGGGALGVLIPPSINMMIYGTITETSVSKLFMAGVVPGLLCAALFMAFVAVACWINPSLAPKETTRYTLKEKIKSSGGLFSFVCVIVFVLGSIYSGWATTTESAALGASVAFILSFLSGGLTFANVRKALITSVKISSMILAIIFSAKALSYFIAISGMSGGVAKGIVALNPSLPVFMVCIVLMYLILGTLLEGTTMMYLTLPILMPILVAMKIDLIWFGIIVTLMTEIGMITPPVGINLYVIQGIMGGKNAFRDVIMGSLPYCIIYLVLTFLVIVFPALALWLPSTM